jgi:dihydroneopterin aldolase
LAPDRITLKNMAFFAYHGTAPSEKESGQRFFVDVDMYLDLRPAALADDLERTVDYEGVYHLIKENCESKRFYLIEALAEHVARSILEGYPVERVVVRVRKPSVPVRGILDFTEVEVDRTRAD